MQNKLKGRQLERFLERNDVTIERYGTAYAKGERWCCRCKSFLSQDSFSPRKGRPGRVNSICKSCCVIHLGPVHEKWQREHPEKLKKYHADYYEKNKDTMRSTSRKRYKALSPKERWRIGRTAALKRNYGITLEQYEGMVKKQKGRCAICFQKPKRGPLHVDHDHVKKTVRDLLCSPCNLFLGHFEIHRERIPVLIAYLEKYR